MKKISFDQPFVQGFLLALAYGFGLWFFQWFLWRLGVAATFPNNDNLIQWDAGWYRNIVDNGYNDASHNTGFFVLFPWVWKYSCLNALGVSILNAFFFAAGLGLLMEMLTLKARDVMPLLALPSIMFFYVPYTESLFFLLCVIAMHGTLRRRQLQVGVALFLVAMARPTAVFLLPAFFAAELFANPLREWKRALIRFATWYASPLVAGTLAFMLVQYLQTGVWMAYFNQQSTNWGHGFKLPTLPFESGDGPRMWWLMALGLAVGLAAFVHGLALSVRWCKGETHDRMFVLATGYLAAVLLMQVFFSPTWTGRTNLLAIHRYMIATPFFIVFVMRRFGLSEDWRKDLFIILALSLSAIMAFGAYKHLQAFLFYLVVPLTFIAVLQWARTRSSVLGMILFGVMFLLQVFLFQNFLTRLYVD